MEDAYRTAAARIMQVLGPDSEQRYNDLALSFEQYRALREYLHTCSLRNDALGKHLYESVPGGALCDACKTLPSKLEQELKRRSQNSVKEDKPQSIVHLDNARTLLTSREICRVCALFSYVASEWGKRPRSLEDSLGNDPLRIITISDIDSALPEKKKSTAGLRLVVPWKTTDVVDRWLSRGLNDGNSQLESLQNIYDVSTQRLLLAMARPPSSSRGLANYVHGRLPFEQGECDELYAWLSTCLYECETRHVQCQRASDLLQYMENHDESPLPTRTIQIGRRIESHGYSLRLISTSGIRAKYAALSHCWGNPKNHPPMTTVDNFKQHQTAIRMLELPKTFQDAIRVTVRLGLQYLWIDSLCIIQDDEQDWHAEAIRMSSVYGNAHVTLAASHAYDSKQGLFFPRPRLEHEAIASIPITPNKPTEGEVLLIGEQYVGSLPILGALMTRAWCYQEEILSRRLIWFTHAQIIWDCCECDVAETGLQTTHSSALGKGRQTRILQEWQSIITGYSGRSISKAKDRPIALLGLAEKAKQLSPQLQYQHGIWFEEDAAGRRTMGKACPPSSFHQLLWARDNSQRHVTGLSELPKLKLPSWSWLSIPAPVTYMFRQESDLHCVCRADVSYTGAKTLQIRSHAFSTKLYALYGDVPDERLEIFWIYYRAVRDNSMSLGSACADGGNDGAISQDFNDTIARLRIMGLFGEYQLGFVPDAYIFVPTNPANLCGWAIFDDPADTPENETPLCRSCVTVPMLSWYKAGSKVPVIHQILILEDISSGEEDPSLQHTCDSPCAEEDSGQTTGRSERLIGPLKRVGVGFLTSSIGEALFKLLESSEQPSVITIR